MADLFRMSSRKYPDQLKPGGVELVIISSFRQPGLQPSLESISKKFWFVSLIRHEVCLTDFHAPYFLGSFLTIR